MGAGKSTVGWHLAKILGLGFIDVDKQIEQKERKPIAQLFADRGEAAFREVEAQEIRRLKDLRNHVIAVGGGAVVLDESWATLSAAGVTVWLNPAPSEIARRLLADELELKKRPLLADVLEQQTTPERLAALTERLASVVSERQARYAEARISVSDAFSTPETTAKLIRDLLIKEGLYTTGQPHQAFDRWQHM